MTPADFAREIVIPTLEDFQADRTSRRWAYLSAIAVYHLRDYLAEALVPLAGERKVNRRAVEAEAARVDDAVRAALPSPEAFNTVEAVAIGAKHALTRSPRGVTFTAGSDWARPEVLYGEGSFGTGAYGGIGGREIPHEGTGLDVYRAAQATFLAFLVAFPNHLAGCTFEPYPHGQ